MEKLATAQRATKPRIVPRCTNKTVLYTRQTIPTFKTSLQKEETIAATAGSSREQSKFPAVAQSELKLEPLVPKLTEKKVAMLPESTAKEVGHVKGLNALVHSRPCFQIDK